MLRGVVIDWVLPRMWINKISFRSNMFLKMFILSFLFSSAFGGSIEEDVKIYNLFALVTDHHEILINANEMKILMSDSEKLYFMIRDKIEKLNDKHTGVYRDFKEVTRKEFPVSCQISKTYTFFRIKHFVLQQKDADIFFNCFKNMTETVVIDLRGNSGGLFSTSNQISSFFLNMPYQMGEMFQVVNSGIVKFDEPEHVFKTLSYAPKDLNNFEKESVYFKKRERINPFFNKKNQFSIKNKFYIIYDKECSSACETFLLSMKDYSGTSLVSNSSSFGGPKSANPFSVKLPKSGIFVKLPIARFHYKSDLINKGFSILPDFKINKLPKEIFDNLQVDPDIKL